MTILRIISLAWCVRLFLNLLTYIHLWYVKEYRLDRILIHLKSKQGKRLLFLPWRRPPIKPKACFVFICSVIVLVGLNFILPLSIIWKLFIMDLLLFPITTVFVLIAKVPTLVYHEVIIRKAVHTLRLHGKMTVIGITGSYGKTSTKEILATILSEKFKTLKTEASKNSPIGIAEVVLSTLLPQHEVFIVEMGAYKRGEIAKMCAMVRPEIGIVTAINEQHQDLFGSIEETVTAKYELIQGLSGTKIAIFNADNTYTQKMANRAKNDGCDVMYFSGGDTKSDYLNILRASNIRLSEDGLSFTMRYKNETTDVRVALFGEHQVENVLAASAAALSAGMKLPEIAKACLRVRPFAHTMKPLPGLNGSIFIDDTFNNNPDAARAAIDYLRTTRGKKILVFQPMIELGSFARRRHREIGTYAAAVCDEIILTNDSYLEDFTVGVQSEKKKTRVSVMSASVAAKYLRTEIKKSDTVLFKGKEAARVLTALI